MDCLQILAFVVHTCTIKHRIIFDFGVGEDVLITYASEQSCFGVYIEAFGSSGDPSESRNFETVLETGVTKSVGMTANI